MVSALAWTLMLAAIVLVLMALFFIRRNRAIRQYKMDRGII